MSPRVRPDAIQVRLVHMQMPCVACSGTGVHGPTSQSVQMPGSNELNIQAPCSHAWEKLKRTCRSLLSALPGP